METLSIKCIVLQSSPSGLTEEIRDVISINVRDKLIVTKNKDGEEQSIPISKVAYIRIESDVPCLVVNPLK